MIVQNERAHFVTVLDGNATLGIEHERVPADTIIIVESLKSLKLQVFVRHVLTSVKICLTYIIHEHASANIHVMVEYSAYSPDDH